MIDARQFCKAYIKEVQEDKIIDPSGKRYIDIYRTDSKFTDLVNYTLIPNVIQSIDSELTVQHLCLHIRLQSLRTSKDQKK